VNRDRPSRHPFDRFPVVGYRIEQGERNEERFYVSEMDLPNDDLGPMKPPPPRSEIEARTRLAELGLTEPEIDARIAWAKKWMATVIRQPGAEPVVWLPPL
jgi:hypothetical protein